MYLSKTFPLSTFSLLLHFLFERPAFEVPWLYLCETAKYRCEKWTRSPPVVWLIPVCCRSHCSAGHRDTCLMRRLWLCNCRLLLSQLLWEMDVKGAQTVMTIAKQGARECVHCCHTFNTHSDQTTTTIHEAHKTQWLLPFDLTLFLKLWSNII